VATGGQPGKDGSGESQNDQELDTWGPGAEKITKPGDGNFDEEDVRRLNGTSLPGRKNKEDRGRAR